MADSKELQTQLQLNQQINKVLADRSKQMDALNKQISGQALLAKELCKAMECRDLDGLEDRIQSLNSSLEKAASAASKAGGSLQEAAVKPNKDLEEQGGLISNISSKLSSAKVAAVTFGASMMSVGKRALGALTMAANAIAPVVSGLLNIGKSIVSIPFKVLGGFVSAAASGSGGVNELRQAMEKLRGEMGDLSTGEGKAVMDGFSQLRSSSSALAKSGLSVGQVFGYGADGAAKMLEAVGELAKAAGPQFSMLSDQIAGAADKMVMMNKGLGMTNESLAEMARKAHNTGKDVGDELIEMGSMAIQMGNKFGVSAKTIGKNVSALTESMEDFGGMSKKQLTATATYMAKLGIEAKDLQGVIAKFDDFESAAEGVSQLNQAFGIQLDTMEMMNAQNPAERIDQMRNAFHAAGKSVEDMTRAEKKLMAEQMGLSVSAMENALAVENQGIAYEDMEAAAEESEANKMSEKEVMLELAKSIEKLVKGGQGVTGFFDAFAKGFERGFKRNKEYIESIRAIRKSLKVVKEFGVEVGKVFADLMGTFGLFEGVKKIFDPKAIRELLMGENGILGYIKKFAKSTGEGGKYSLGDMIKDIFNRVYEYLTGGAVAEGTSAFSKWIEKMITTIGDGIASAIPIVFEYISKFLDFLTKAITDPDSLKDIAPSAQEGIGGALMEAFQKIGESLSESGPQLWESLKALLGAVWEKVGPFIADIGAKILTAAIIKTIVISAAKAAVSAVVTSALKYMGQKIFGTAGEEMKKSAPKAMEKGGGGFFGSLGAMIESIAKIDTKAAGQAAINLLILAGTFMVALIGFAATILIMYLIIGKIPWEGLAKVFVTIGVAVLATLGLALISLMLEPTTMSTAAAFLLIAAVTMFAALLVYAGAILVTYELLKTVPFDGFLKTMGMIGVALLATLAFVGVGLALAAVGQALPFVALGLVAAAAFFVGGVYVFAEAINYVAPMLRQIAGLSDIIDKSVWSIIKIVTVIGGMVALGAIFTAIMPVLPVLALGFYAASKFFNSAIGSITSMINTVAKIPITDPDKVAKKVSIVADIAKAMQAVAAVGLDAAKMAIVGKLFGGSSVADMFASMEGFIITVADTLKSVVDKIVELARGLSKKDMKGVETIANVLSALGSFAGAMMEPLRLISEMSTDIFGPSAQDATKAMTDGLNGIMDVLVGRLPTLITKIKEEAQKIGNVEELKPKFEIISAIVKATGEFATAFGSILKELPEAGVFEGHDDQVLKLMNAMTGIVNAIGNELTKLINTFVLIAKKIVSGEDLAAKVKIISTIISSVKLFAETMTEVQGLEVPDGSSISAVMGNVMTQMSKVITGSDNSMDSFLTKLSTVKLDETGLQNLEKSINIVSKIKDYATKIQETAEFSTQGFANDIFAIVESVNQSIEALNSVGSINANVALDNFAQAIGVGKGTVTVTNEPVNITMHVNVTMDADKVGKVLVDRSVMTTPLATAGG